MVYYRAGGRHEKALDKVSLSADAIDCYEINEAFSMVTLAAMRELGLDHDKVHCWGGAVSLGHPIGCSGARILVTLLSVMEKDDLKKGCASLCIGGGEGVAMIVERS